ncbi:MAG TPA: oligopeptide ABC transporter permease [Actinomycetota bacterium]|nr:oligopeptide ABC transporter permease [Actinomycetota bacterium]
MSAAADRVLTTHQLAWRRFKRHKLAIASAIILILLALSTIVVDYISQFGFAQQNLLNRVQGPSSNHWFGTDQLGRDVFTRVLYGGRISLLVGLSVALSAVVIGGIVGAIAGYYGRWIDNTLMRVTDLFLSIPFLVILIIGATFLADRPWVPFRPVGPIVLILSLFFWMPDARIVRGVFLSLKEKEFVEAARASGAANRRIIFYHMLPNAMGPIIVNGTLSVAAAILTESALSFLGFGVQPPTPTWGNLLNGSRQFATLYPWLVWFPGLAILVTVLCVNFLGDGLRDALDPHQKIGAPG